MSGRGRNTARGGRQDAGNPASRLSAAKAEAGGKGSYTPPRNGLDPLMKRPTIVGRGAKVLNDKNVQEIKLSVDRLGNLKQIIVWKDNTGQNQELTPEEYDAVRLAAVKREEQIKTVLSYPKRVVTRNLSGITKDKLGLSEKVVKELEVLYGRAPFLDAVPQIETWLAEIQGHSVEAYRILTMSQDNFRAFYGSSANSSQAEEPIPSQEGN